MVDGTKALAALWGFAEATVFFIVPDVHLSWLALRSRPREEGLLDLAEIMLGPSSEEGASERITAILDDANYHGAERPDVTRSAHQST